MTNNPTGYEIERNVNGNWISIGETAVQNGKAGTSTSIQTFNPSGNTLLYRLKINAASSRVSCSGVIRISQDAGLAGNILLYPNPAVNAVQVSVDMASDQTVSLHVRTSPETGIIRYPDTVCREKQFYGLTGCRL
ncbi:MAG: hypothetical protein IPP93_16245 [Chitinophagaceae bacterium]|nr:hypothetical protein [Chitinophagaceae bacterium]